MSDYDHTYAMELSGKLAVYTNLMADSYQEAIDTMCQLSRYSDYLSAQLYSALVIEMERALKNFEENYEIVEEERTVTHTVVELREKEWVYDFDVDPELRAVLDQRMRDIIENPDSLISVEEMIEDLIEKGVVTREELDKAREELKK